MLMCTVQTYICTVHMINALCTAQTNIEYYVALVLDMHIHNRKHLTWTFQSRHDSVMQVLADIVTLACRHFDTGLV